MGRTAVFTAIDGTLLDALTFDAGVNRRAIQKLQAAGVPVIPMSVMTLEELAPIATDLGMRTAMVIEAGGAIARWGEGDWVVEPCGPPAETLLDVVRDIEDRSGACLNVYSVLSEREASQLSGRTGEMLKSSIHRCYSEPFVIESGDPAAVERAAAALGFSVRRGSRFFHLCRECDEGEAFSRLKSELGIETAIAVGGSPIDADFLTKADVRIIVPRADGGVDRELLEKVPDARIAPSPAPAGWAAAVHSVWPVPARASRALEA